MIKLNTIKQKLMVGELTAEVQNTLLHISEMETQWKKAADYDIWEDSVFLTHSSFVLEWCTRLWFEPVFLKHSTNTVPCDLITFMKAAREYEVTFGEFLTDSLLVEVYSYFADLFETRD